MFVAGVIADCRPLDCPLQRHHHPQSQHCSVQCPRPLSSTGEIMPPSYNTTLLGSWQYISSRKPAITLVPYNHVVAGLHTFLVSSFLCFLWLLEGIPNVYCLGAGHGLFIIKMSYSDGVISEPEHLYALSLDTDSCEWQRWQRDGRDGHRYPA